MSLQPRRGRKPTAPVTGVKPKPKNLQPQGKLPRRPATFHERPLRWLIRHRIFYRIMRGRLRCPACENVGCYKPYGRWWKDRDCKRWLCKWCGYYDGVDERTWCVIDKTQGCWVKSSEFPEGTTPQKIAESEGFNPWAG